MRRRKYKCKDVYPQKRSFVRQLASSLHVMPPNVLPTLCHEQAAYTFTKVMEPMVVIYSQCEVVRFYFSNSQDIYRTGLSLQGVEESVEVPTAKFVVKLIARPAGNSREVFMYFCTQLSRDPSTPATKGFCSCLNGVSHRLPCLPMTSVLTVYAEELATNLN